MPNNYDLHRACFGLCHTQGKLAEQYFLFSLSFFPLREKKEIAFIFDFCLLVGGEKRNTLSWRCQEEYGLLIVNGSIFVVCIFMSFADKKHTKISKEYMAHIHLKSV